MIRKQVFLFSLIAASQHRNEMKLKVFPQHLGLIHIIYTVRGFFFCWFVVGFFCYVLFVVVVIIFSIRFVVSQYVLLV